MRVIDVKVSLLCLKVLDGLSTVNAIGDGLRWLTFSHRVQTPCSLERFD